MSSGDMSAEEMQSAKMATQLAKSAVLTLPKLPYELGALAPYISAEIMDLHYNKHHKGYVDKYNAACEERMHILTTSTKGGRQLSEEEKYHELERLARDIHFNGGGHVNHAEFWKSLIPRSSFKELTPTSTLYTAVVSTFGSMDQLKKRMREAAMGVQGSGWVWLVFRAVSGALDVITTANQDPVPAPDRHILGIDVWEHAYYLDYKNDKGSYIDQIWNIINWSEVERRYTGNTTARESYYKRLS